MKKRKPFLAELEVEVLETFTQPLAVKNMNDLSSLKYINFD